MHYERAVCPRALNFHPSALKCHFKHPPNALFSVHGCHDLPKRTYENTETDFYEYRNGPEQTSAHTEMNFNGNQKRQGGVR